MSHVLKWSKRVCILFSFIRRLRGQDLHEALNLGFGHCLPSLDEFNPCKDVWVRLGDDIGMLPFNIVVGSGHVLVKIYSSSDLVGIFH